MPSPDPQPAFVLIRPQMGENIGAAARAMWNFGLDRMRIVAPRDGWPNQKAVAMASGAGRLLDEAQLFDDTPGAIGDCSFVYATTARPRGLTKPVFTPEAAMQDARARIAAGEKVAVMFGPERRRHHVRCRFFEVLVAVNTLINHQMACQHLAVDRLAVLAGVADFLQRIGGGDVHQIHRRA